MRLYGSTTSPFARRVRIVAAELGLAMDMVDTLTPEGQAALRRVTPIWKVPVLEDGGTTIFDSHAIVDYLILRHGAGPLRLPAEADRWREANLHAVIDAAIDAILNVRYMELDGVNVDAVPYLRKQRERTASALGFVERELRDGYFTSDPRVGLTEIALVTALDWMAFRAVFPVDSSPVVASFRALHAARPSFANTRPGT